MKGRRSFCPEQSNGMFYGDRGSGVRIKFRPAGERYGGLASRIRIEHRFFVSWLLDLIRSGEAKATQEVSLADGELTMDYYRTTDDGSPAFAMVVRQAGTVLDAFMLDFQEIEVATGKVYYRLGIDPGSPGYRVEVMASPAYDMRITVGGRTEDIRPTAALMLDKLIHEIDPRA